MRESVLTIITDTITINAEGFEVKTEAALDVPCTVKSVSRSEFYAAYAQGLQADVVFIVHCSAYAGQQRLKFEGNYYTVVRSYERDDEFIEITARRRQQVPQPAEHAL